MMSADIKKLKMGTIEIEGLDYECPHHLEQCVPDSHGNTASTRKEQNMTLYDNTICSVT